MERRERLGLLGHPTQHSPGASQYERPFLEPTAIKKEGGGCAKAKGVRRLGGLAPCCIDVLRTSTLEISLGGGEHHEKRMPLAMDVSHQLSGKALVKFHKADLAERQLDTAIDLFIEDEDEDFVSAFTLAGAAEEVLGNLISLQDDEKAVLRKHANDPKEDVITVERWMVAQMIMRAMVNHQKLNRRPTPAIPRMIKWFGENADFYHHME